MTNVDSTLERNNTFARKFHLYGYILKNKIMFVAKYVGLNASQNQFQVTLLSCSNNILKTGFIN